MYYREPSQFAEVDQEALGWIEYCSVTLIIGNQDS